MPSAIFETMSHQSFPDMKYGQDPEFKFTLARSIYKTVLRYISEAHDADCTVAPLAPAQLKVEFVNRKKGEIRLSWLPTIDPQEPTARSAGYIVYTATGSGDSTTGSMSAPTAVHYAWSPAHSTPSE